MNAVFTITNAGLAALNFANANGETLLLNKIGLGIGQYTPTQEQTDLVAEVKQITSIAGSVVSDIAISITLRDESADAYDVSEIGIFTDNDELFAVYANPSQNIISKTADSNLFLDIDIKFVDVDVSAINFGDTSFANPQASETVKGVMLIATEAEAIAGEDDEKAMTPLKVHRKLGDLVGMVVGFPLNSPPNGWLKCNGAELSRTTYADLFAVMGTLFGAGDGSTTFNLPDARGEFLRGWDDGRGVDIGRALGSWQADELRSHRHTSDVANGSMTIPNNSNVNRRVQGGYTGYFGGDETRPRNLALLYCIKY